MLATGGGGDDKTVRLWRPDQPADSVVLTGHTGLVVWGAWATVDGRPVLATGGGGDNTVRLWPLVAERPVERLPGYRSDTATGRDELARSDEAAAVAELVTARSVRPPLAVGLFGDWGEGKSHFLDLLQASVTTATQEGNSLAHRHVRQVRFNAWHYAETDLWASLVAEIFSQLATPAAGSTSEATGHGPDVRVAQRQQGRLAAEIVERRRIRERLVAAQARLHELQSARRISQRLSSSGAAELAQAADQLAPDFAGQTRRIYQAAAGGGHRLLGRLRLIRATWAALGDRTKLLMLGAAGIVLLLLLLPLVIDLTDLTRDVARVVAAVAAAVTGTTLWRQGRGLWKEAKKLWGRAVLVAGQEHSRIQTAIDVQTAEVDELTRELQNLTTAGQLAGFVADRAASGGYRSRLGVMTQIREDFTHMAQLLVGNSRADRAEDEDSGSEHAGGRIGPGQARKRDDVDQDAAGDALPAIDRIIIYIDDLDRCPPHRVVQMLEAIHLLLAVELFVVVVAVDPRWLLRAIAVHYHEMLQVATLPADTARGGPAVDPDDEELWRSTPAHYLEKIFQVVLTLPPLDQHGYERLLTTLVNVRRDRAPNPSVSAADVPTSAGTPEPVVELHGPEGSGGSDDWTALLPARPGEPVPLPAPPLVDKVDLLALEPDELTLLELLGPPLLVTTPRAVKRLANSYGLLTALRENTRTEDLAAQPATGPDETQPIYAYRAAAVLLAALVAYPALGPALFLYLHHRAGADPDLPWAEFLTELDPTRGPTGWRNAADPALTPVQAQQWQALLRGLRSVEDAAAPAGLPLPQPLHIWANWVVPVGRLSFPTGRIVSSLDRLQPLSANETPDEPRLPAQQRACVDSATSPPAPRQ